MKGCSNKSLGFSLIELLIVLAIVGILASVGFMFYENHRYKSQCHEAGGHVEIVYVPQYDSYQTLCVFNREGVYCRLVESCN